MSEQILSLICINMINTNIFISPGASGLAEVHLQHVAYGNQVTTSKGDTQGVLGDVVQAAVRDLVDHPVDLRCSQEGSSGSSLTAGGNWKSCHDLWWPTSCGTALVSACHFPVDSLSREKERLGWRKQMSFPPSIPTTKFPPLCDWESCRTQLWINNLRLCCQSCTVKFSGTFQWSW